VSVSELMPEHPPGSVHTGNVTNELARGQVNLHVNVVSPDRSIFEGEAHWVTLTGVDGQLGIWPRHVTMVAALGSGPLRIGLRDRTVTRFAARGGFVSVAANTVTILVDRALTQAEVDEAEAQRDFDETVAALAHPGSDEEFVALLDTRAWSQERLKLAKG
jgi:F-type H+-transporting ATPase subunit epsilon